MASPTSSSTSATPRASAEACGRAPDPAQLEAAVRSLVDDRLLVELDGRLLSLSIPLGSVYMPAQIYRAALERELGEDLGRPGWTLLARLERSVNASS